MDKKGRDFRLDLPAPLMFEILNLWNGFKEVAKLIENNRVWLDALMGKDYLYRTNNCRYGE